MERYGMIHGYFCRALRLRLPSVFSYLLFMVLLTRSVEATSPDESPVDFARDIRPLLVKNCFSCHGPDEGHRKAKLRLDDESSFFEDRGGFSLITPKDADSSELYYRISSVDGDRMPPPGFAALPDETIDLLRLWIEQGAPYRNHWSFEKPGRNEPPSVQDDSWVRQPFDRFIRKRLEEEGLSPNPVGSRATLLRRVSLDVTGLPPTLLELDAFLSDKDDRAYEKMVDRMLSSPAYGEHWARTWLDLARYADTKGYEADRRRTIWRYRDWVIQALNDDMAFDRFTTEQIAGDLLPEATIDQKLATAFHRNTMTNEEGGTDDEEFRMAAVKDRVDTTFQVWMGLTAGCAKCHSHKFDPLSQVDYYSFLAFLNQTEDSDRGDEAPVLETPSDDQAEDLAALQQEITDVQTRFNQETPELHEDRETWITEEEIRFALPKDPALLSRFSTWSSRGPFPAENVLSAFNKKFAPEEFTDTKGSLDSKSIDQDGSLRWIPRPEWKDGQVHSLPATVGATYLYRTLDLPRQQTVVLSFGSDDAIKVWLDGEEVISHLVNRAAGPDQERFASVLPAGESNLLVKIVNGGGVSGFYFQSADLPPQVRSILEIPKTKRTQTQSQSLSQYHRSITPVLKNEREELAGLIQERRKLAIPMTPVMRELPEEQQRKTYVHQRGNFLAPGKEVHPEVPERFHPLPEDAPKNRLGVAMWIVSEENPLTARVAVNRIWARIFGVGLVETEEDFGSQGTYPSHPELLDWLATEFPRLNWSMKGMVRSILLSATYRQSSDATKEQWLRDPKNRLMGRGPRFRLDAESIRDSALSVAGLLSSKMYGPSVMPPQPPGLWRSVYSADDWVTSENEDRYRRGIYTFYKRTSPYPSSLILDAPSREICQIRRIRTNTPLAALVLLNDPVYVEAAQALARRIVLDGGKGTADKIRHAYRRALCRNPTPAEVDELQRLYDLRHQSYTRSPDLALSLATHPLGPLPPKSDVVELAAWTSVCNVILNLDEFVTKR